MTLGCPMSKSKSKIKNQKSKIKNQKSKSKIKNQKSKIKNQKSKIKNQKSKIEKVSLGKVKYDSLASKSVIDSTIRQFGLYMNKTLGINNGNYIDMLL